MEIFHDKDEQKFYMKNQDIYAEICYSNAEEGAISIDHTWVDEEYKGKGLGKMLMDELTAFARREHLKIIPVCPFIKVLVERYPDEYQDLIK